jgi:uncharacterized membrane protein YphA (DoxX/SURF4 family)
VYRYLPLLALRLALAVVFGYFGYRALVYPESQLAFVSPTLEAASPLPLATVVLIVGVAEVAAALAFALGVWLSVAGLGAATLLAGIISSIGLGNEIGLRDLVILTSCLVVASSTHRVALQPTVKRTRLLRLAGYVAVLLGTYAWLLA